LFFLLFLLVFTMTISFCSFIQSQSLCFYLHLKFLIFLFLFFELNIKVNFFINCFIFKAKDYDKLVTQRANDEKVFNQTFSPFSNNYDDAEDEIVQNNHKPSKNKQQKQQIAKKVQRSSSLQEKTEEKDRDYEETSSMKGKLNSKGRVPIKIQQNSVQQKSEVKKVANEPRPRLDLSKKAKEDRENFDTILRIRDPVTSKVRTINLKDNEIDELARRHEEEKNKVYKLMKNETQDRHFNGLETVKEVNSVPESFRSTHAQQPPQQVAQQQKIQQVDEVDELINRHQREKVNAQQIKTTTENKKTDLNETHNKSDHFDDLEI
jgi:hypothetical protein